MIPISLNQTKKIAEDLAGKVLKLKKHDGAIVIGLSGELGSGKTTFCQSFAKALGVKEKIHSPTFVIFRRYGHLLHFDAYRLKNPREIIALGWKKIISDPNNIVLVEWAENVRKIFPKKYFWINLRHLGKNKRGIDIKFIK